MAHESPLAQIIARSSPPDVPRLRAIAKELRWRAGKNVRRAQPHPDSAAPEPSAIRAMTLLQLCREAMEALGPESRKLYLVGDRGASHSSDRFVAR